MQKILFVVCLLIAGKCVSGQSLPPYTCGILYTYDLAGKRIKQEYLCREARSISQNDSLNSVSTSFAKVNAIYPNPNDGHFAVRFERELKNGDIIITDVNGKKVSHFKAKGVTVQFDISDKPAGTYFIIIRDGKITIRQKVVKQY